MLEPAVITRPGPLAAPVTYKLSATERLKPTAAFAHWNGAAASGAFLPALSFYTQDGKLFSRVFPTQVAQGDVADVSYAPFPGGVAGGGIEQLTSVDSSVVITNPSGPTADLSARSIPLSLVAFNPAGNLVNVVSTNPAAPTLVFSFPALTFDGLTTIRIEFYASAVDMDMRGRVDAGSVLLELYDGTTALGVIEDFGVGSGGYGVTSCFVAAYDTPSAGSHTYTIQGYRQSSLGGPMGAANVYGTAVTTPHATRPGFGAIFLS